MNTTFLSAVYKTTLYFPQVIISQIQNKDRHFFCQSHSKFNVGDVVVVEPKDSEMILSKTRIELLITARDVTSELTVYSFVSIADMPDALHDLVSGIYAANCQLLEDKTELIKQNMALLSINAERAAQH